MLHPSWAFPSQTLRAREKVPSLLLSAPSLFSTQNQGKSRAPEGQRQERQWTQSSIRRTSSISIASGRGKFLGDMFETLWHGWRRPTMQYQLTHRWICLKPCCDCWKTNAHKCGWDYRPTERPKRWDSIEGPMVLLARETPVVTHGRDCCGKASSEKYSSNTFGKRYQRGSVFMSTENHNHFLLL